MRKTEMMIIDDIEPKVAAVGGAGSWFLAELFVPGASLPFFDVTISTLGMAVAGSMLGFAYGAPVESRKVLYGFAIGGTFIGVWAVHLLRWRGIEVPDFAAPPIAGVTALLSRWIIPLIVDFIGPFLKRIFNVNSVTGKKPD
jgi:hypothetical protein